MTDRELIALFGSESTGRTPEERARSSRRRFVRGQDALAEWSDGARGRVLTAWEALMDHGLDVLREANDSDSAIICDSHDTASLNLKDRRLALGLDLDYVANRARMNSADVRDAEESKRRVPIHRLERIARVLGLDEHRISRRDAGASTAELAVRLRTIGGKSSVVTPRAVLTLAEAHWVGRTQKRLERWLGMEPTPRTFLPRPVYLDRLSALRAGLRLADETRRDSAGGRSLTSSLRAICEDLLGIPVVQADLPKRIAGATISSAGVRILVVNTQGSNDNAWVRRSTYAHEIGHILWDLPTDLRDLRVDQYDDLDSRPDDLHDPV